MGNSGGSKIFQTVLLFIFLIGGIGALFLFSLGSNKSGSGQGDVTVWGSMSESAFEPIINAQMIKDKKLTVTYKRIDDSQIASKLLEAIASGKSPDLVILPQQEVWNFRNKVAVFPYAGFPERTFRDTFIQGTEFLLEQQGILGYPFTVDPLVLYWNRDMFDTAGISQAPPTWEDVANDIPLLLKKLPDNSVTQGAIAMGNFYNVTHAKDILSALWLQSNVTITSYDKINNQLISILKGPITQDGAEHEAASFFTSFADPFSTAYSWNASLPQSKNMFIGNGLAMYIGYASEIEEIRTKNPNLNFDIALMPQLKSAQTKITYGQFKSLIVPKGAPNTAGAYALVSTMIDPTVQRNIQSSMLFPPVRRDMFSASETTDPYYTLIYASALISRTWIDPSPLKTNDIFKGMVSSIGEKVVSPNEAVSQARDLLQNAINQQ